MQNTTHTFWTYPTGRWVAKIHCPYVPFAVGVVGPKPDQTVASFFSVLLLQQREWCIHREGTEQTNFHCTIHPLQMGIPIMEVLDAGWKQCKMDVSILIIWNTSQKEAIDGVFWFLCCCCPKQNTLQALPNNVTPVNCAVWGAAGLAAMEYAMVWDSAMHARETWKISSHVNARRGNSSDTRYTEKETSISCMHKLVVKSCCRINRSWLTRINLPEPAQKQHTKTGRELQRSSSNLR